MTEPTAPETPELDRRSKVIESGRTDTLAWFIDWLNDNGYAIAHRCTHVDQKPGRRCWDCGDSGFIGAVTDYESLIARHFGLDPAKIEAEMQKLLDYQRALNATQES
ncbi:hypothetical protein ACFVBP_10385 [Nocardioides sp. NPDC057764]|uniref:hypothetical protein n=1 Tax=Nocardioides sp. NPDC057764 TaxID=3346243 RepID=UPI00366E08C3